MRYIQDVMSGNHCYGCGTINDKGLAIKSRRNDDGSYSCEFMPEAHHCAAPTHFLNGGIMATIIDCHCICAAIDYAYRQQGRLLGDTDNDEHKAIWFATSTLTLHYIRPVAMDSPVTLKAYISAYCEQEITLSCELISHKKCCVEASVVAVKVPNSWMMEKP